MKAINWNENKNDALKASADRGYVSFERCLEAILADDILDDLVNTVAGREHQRILVLEIDNYVYAVPYVETESEIFLKTAYPSRAFTARY